VGFSKILEFGVDLLLVLYCTTVAVVSDDRGDGGHSDDSGKGGVTVVVTVVTMATVLTVEITLNIAMVPSPSLGHNFSAQGRIYNEAVKGSSVPKFS
jgi:hypothetical protein